MSEATDACINDRFLLCLFVAVPKRLAKRRLSSLNVYDASSKAGVKVKSEKEIQIDSSIPFSLLSAILRLKEAAVDFWKFLGLPRLLCLTG